MGNLHRSLWNGIDPVRRQRVTDLSCGPGQGLSPQHATRQIGAHLIGYVTNTKHIEISIPQNTYLYSSFRCNGQ